MAGPADERLTPFLNWAGGKRWLYQFFDERPLPIEGTYYEPFLGSGAMFFYWRPSRAVLSDSNAQLIETYRACRDDHEKVVSELRRHARDHSPDYYYVVRASKPRAQYTRAAQLIYLNRTCWNGLYRVNKSGQFNVPIGTKDNVLRDDDDFSSVATLLRSAEIVCSDFEQQIDRASSDDLVFADPPYTVRHNHNGFIKYNEQLFSWDDQVRLRDALLRAKRRGALIVHTNADHKSIRKLYERDFEIVELSRFSAIAASGSRRGTYAELLIR